MVNPPRLERAIVELQPLLNNDLSEEEHPSANIAWTILRNGAPIKFDNDLPNEIREQPTDDELETIKEYLDEVQAEINRLYDIAYRDAVDE